MQNNSTLHSCRANMVKQRQSRANRSDISSQLAIAICWGLWWPCNEFWNSPQSGLSASSRLLIWVCPLELWKNILVGSWVPSMPIQCQLNRVIWYWYGKIKSKQTEFFMCALLTSTWQTRNTWNSWYLEGCLEPSKLKDILLTWSDWEASLHPLKGHLC